MKEFDSLASLNQSGEALHGFVESLSEGPISMEVSNTADKTLYRKTGGFGIYVFKDAKRDLILRIIYHDTIDKNFYETYYYEDNKLVYGRVDYKDEDRKQTVLFSRTGFYHNGALLKEERNRHTKFKPPVRAKLDLLKGGNERLKSALKNSSH